MTKDTGIFADSNIEIISESANFIGLQLDLISAAKESFDCYIDSEGLLSYFIETKSLWDEIRRLKDRGIRSRFVIEITPENVRDCNMLMKYTEVFHNDGLKGNFLIVDGIKYLCYILQYKKKNYCPEKQNTQIRQLFYTEVKPFIDAQQYLLNNLYYNATSAQEKIRGISRSAKVQFVNVIRTPSEIQKTTTDLLKLATHEILFLFSTTNSLYRANHSGILNSLWEASQRGVTVKALIQSTGNNNNDQLKVIIEKIIREKNLPVIIQYITKPLEAKITTLVVDQAVSLAIEVDDDTKKTFEESRGVSCLF